MNTTVSLPNGRRSFGIRCESVGGLGAHAAAQALATAAVTKMGLNGVHFSSRGPERKGARTQSFVALVPGNQPIRASEPVQTPDLVVVFHAALLRDPATFAGLRKDGTLIYNGAGKRIPEELAALPATARCLRIDALGIAAKEKSTAQAAMLGAICGAFPFLDAESTLEALGEDCASGEPDLLASCARAFRRAAAELETLSSVGQAEGDLPPASHEPAWGYRTQPFGGILDRPGTTAWNDLSASRTGSLPAFNRERCIHCGLCDLVCPDFCLVWEPGEKGGRFERELTGVDYRYCKGCLRCVESCPASALLKKSETPGFADQRTVPLFPDLVA